MDHEDLVTGSSRNPFGGHSSISTNTRSNSISNSGGSVPGSPTSTRTFSSFLSRATSVTTSSVTDRLGSVKSAISSQLQQVPNIASFSGNVTSSINQLATSSTSNNNSNLFDISGQQQQQQTISSGSNNNSLQQNTGGNNNTIGSTIQQSIGATSNTIINKTNNLIFSTNSNINNNNNSQVLLVIDGYHTDWSKYFKKAHQKSTFSVGATASSALFSSFSSSVVSSSSDSNIGSNISELIVEQADFREISVRSNSCLTKEPQTSVYINSSRSQKATRIVKPDYVLIRQRTKDKLDHIKNIVIGLQYGLLPMLEPSDVWHIFQDKSLIFTQLNLIQRQLGRERFPLINQIYCQSHLELVQQINNGTITYPCLLRIAPSGRGKIKVDNGQMLLELASIVAMNKAACTIEPYIDTRCDLLIQKIGPKSIKAYIRKTGQIIGDQPVLTRRTSWNKQQQQQQQQSSSSVSSSILATIQSTAGGSFNQAFGGGTSQQQSASGNAIKQQPMFNYEPVQLSDRYRRWVEAVDEHFKSKGGLEMFSIKALISQKDDKDYIIGVSDCTMDLVGDNLDDDRRAVAELVIGHISQLLEKNRAAFVQSDLLSAKLANGTVVTTEILDGIDLQAQKTTRVPSLTGRSQSVSVGSDSVLTRPPLPRRGSREPLETSPSSKEPSSASFKRNVSNLDQLNNATASIDNQGQLGAAKSTSSFMDQTQSAAASAISSFQNKSMNFFRRLDSRQESFSSFIGSSASGSQDKLSSLSGDASYMEPLTTSQVPNISSQTSTVGSVGSVPPPKPPPPNRPPSTPMNITDERQGLATDQMNEGQLLQSGDQTVDQQNSEINPDDTMKNLRKTFAGIFGDI